MPAGRPTKYRPIFIKKIDEYLAQCQDEDINYVTLEGTRTTGYQKRVNVKLPTIEGFGMYIGVLDNETFTHWRKSYPEFSVALDKITKTQRDRLMSKGLSGDYNSTIAKLILAANHGMSDKQDITSNGNSIVIEMSPTIAKKNGLLPK